MLADRKQSRHIEVPAHALVIPDDAAALARGEYLYRSRGCAECHGANGAGRVFAEGGGGLKLAAPNISPGAGSVVARYRAEDWERALRHGVKPDGRPLLVMPSEDHNRLTDADLGAIVAHVRRLPPAAGGAAVLDMPLPMRVLYGFGPIPDAASLIDHRLAPAQPVPEAISIEHGSCVANMCIGCHGQQLAGGRIASGPPDWPPAARLRPGEGNAMDCYPDADLMLRMFRSGRSAGGAALQAMPFETLREISETDVRALHLYLKSLR